MTALASVVAALTASAFSELPPASGKALGVTRGKPFSAGAVFINGKYIEPPYVVERWGTGLRINKMQVSGQVIDWNEFLKTQTDVKVTKTEVAPAPAPVAAPAPVPAPAPAPAAEEDDDSSLDDLFDDDPKPKKKKAKPAAAPVVRRPAAPPKPKQVVTYSLDGDFVPNDASRALLNRINSSRTDIDRILRGGGFICFGDRYSQVTGDARTLMKMLEKLPTLMQNASSGQSLFGSVRAAQLGYLNEVLCEDLYRNRIDYRKLKELHAKLKKENEWKTMLNDVSQPLF